MTGHKSTLPKISIIELIKKHPDFQSVSWVIGCMSKCKDEKRFHITHLKVKDNCFTGTDGNRIHQYQSENNFNDGFYRNIYMDEEKLFLMSNGFEQKYPDCKDILTPAKIEPIELYGNSNECFWAYSQIIRKLDDSILNYNYLYDLLKFRDSFKCHIVDDISPIVFTTHNKSAAIMPMADPLKYKQGK